MNLLLTMKRWQSALASLLLVMLLALPATAGGWVLDGYFWSGSSNSIDLSWSKNYHGGGKDETRTQERQHIGRGDSQDRLGSNTPSHAGISASGMALYGKSVLKSGIAEATAKIGSSVYARFSWQRNMKYGYSEVAGGPVSFPDPDDNPPAYIYVRETATVRADGSIGQRDGNPTGYTNSNKWQGDYFDITGEGMGVSLGEKHRSDNNPANSWGYGPNSKSSIRKVAVSGDSVVVPSQTFSGEVKLSPGYEKEIFDQSPSAYLGFGYGANLLNFSLQASGFTAANREQTNSNTEEIDAMIELRWVSPDNLETGENGQNNIVPSRDQVRGFWKNAFGDQQIDDGAPLPYFAGQATFSVTATGSDGRSPIFNSPVYKWTPEDNSDPFDPDGAGKPGFVAPSLSQRTYVWNFGSAKEGEGSFPQTSSVSVELKSSNPDEGSDSLTETKTINWYTTWSPTETGLQKNIVTSQNGQFVLPDGSPIGISEVKEGDTIMCFVEGDPGFSTDSSHVEKIRPVPFTDQVPGPGERIEPRVVGRIVPTGNGDQIVIFNSTPKVNPDDNPDEAGFDEIQQTREIAATQQQTYQTGKAAVTAALNLYVEAAKFVSIGRLEGWGIEGVVKGAVALGKLGTAVREAKASILLLDEGAIILRNRLRAVEALQKDGRYTISQRAKFAEDALSLRKSLANKEQLAKDARSMVAKSEKYIAEASAEIKTNGCFVAGTPVWMDDGTTKPIEQVKIGDTVLSKNEKTGEIAAKKVTNTSVRPDIWTRKLIFENGAVLETTDEHPLYVDGRGFVKAKEVGIGNSIVTRAGPNAKVVGVQADVRQATVYNFTVDEFHTYFVGQDALWVHNVDCRTYPEPTANGNTLIWEETDAAKLVIDNPASPGSPITDFDRVVKAPNGDIWVVERKGVVDVYNPKSPFSREEQLTKFLDKQITDKLDSIKKAIFQGAPQDLAKAQITDPNRAKIAFDFHGSNGQDIDLTVLGKSLERIKQWEGANPGFDVAVKWGG